MSPFSQNKFGGPREISPAPPLLVGLWSQCKYIHVVLVQTHAHLHHKLTPVCMFSRPLALSLLVCNMLHLSSSTSDIFFASKYALI